MESSFLPATHVRIQPRHACNRPVRCGGGDDHAAAEQPMQLCWTYRFAPCVADSHGSAIVSCSACLPTSEWGDVQLVSRPSSLEYVSPMVIDIL